MTTTMTPSRVSSHHIAWLADHLSPRDWEILGTVNRLQLVTGRQLQRLHFVDFASEGAARASRARTLARLVRWHVLAPLPRRIGGVSHGSAEHIYALDSGGHRLLKLKANNGTIPSRIRRPGAPGERWTAHTLAIAELYVGLVEAARAGQFILRDFRAEPHSWWPDGFGGWLKPDAFAVVSNGRVDHLWWIEVDRATESLPTVQRKLNTYLDFDRRGGLGPRQVMPGVLVTVPTEPRAQAIAAWIRGQPRPAPELLHATTCELAPDFLLSKLPAG